jgi:hypothetical protein
MGRINDQSISSDGAIENGRPHIHRFSHRLPHKANITIGSVLINDGAHLNIQYIVLDCVLLSVTRAIIKPFIVTSEVGQADLIDHICALLSLLVIFKRYVIFLLNPAGPNFRNDATLIKMGEGKNWVQKVHRVGLPNAPLPVIRVAFSFPSGNETIPQLGALRWIVGNALVLS